MSRAQADMDPSKFTGCYDAIYYQIVSLIFGALYGLRIKTLTLVSTITSISITYS